MKSKIKLDEMIEICLKTRNDLVKKYNKIIKEEKEIANILINMDSKIGKLEQEKQKYEKELESYVSIVKDTSKRIFNEVLNKKKNYENYENYDLPLGPDFLNSLENTFNNIRFLSDEEMKEQFLYTWEMFVKQKENEEKDDVTAGMSEKGKELH